VEQKEENQRTMKGMQNGGTLLSTMSLPWLELVFLVSPFPWQLLDGIFQTQI